MVKSQVLVCLLNHSDICSFDGKKEHQWVIFTHLPAGGTRDYPSLDSCACCTAVWKLEPLASCTSTDINRTPRPICAPGAIWSPSAIALPRIASGRIIKTIQGATSMHGLLYGLSGHVKPGIAAHTSSMHFQTVSTAP